MSNVLIGIIGVILFIGLALAGALFLGPRFQEASNNAKAAAVVQSMDQFTKAVNMYQTMEGTPMPAVGAASVFTLANKGYLKSVIVSPFNGAVFSINDATGNGGPDPADHVETNLGDVDNTVAKSVCEAIERQAGGTGTLQSVTDWGYRMKNSHRTGCFLYTLPSPAQYRAYSPI